MTKAEAIIKINEAEAAEAVYFQQYFAGKKFLVPSGNPDIERERLFKTCEKFAKRIGTLEKLKEATESLPEDMSILFEAIAAQADSPLLGMEKTDD